MYEDLSLYIDGEFIQGGDRVSMTIEGLGPALELSVHDAQNRTSWSAHGV